MRMATVSVITGIQVKVGSVLITTPPVGATGTGEIDRLVNVMAGVHWPSILSERRVATRQ